MLVSELFGNVPLDFLAVGNVRKCPYLPGRKAQEELFAAGELHPELYHDLMDHGFRRTGRLFYRPSCPKCSECKPIRACVGGFDPTKSQRRVLRKNEDVHVRIGLPKFTKEKYRIYSDFLTARYDGKLGTPEELEASLYVSPVFTVEMEYEIRGRLVAVSIADLCSRSLSSVYVYYDPDFSGRSLGTLTALREIQWCMVREIPNYYLGFYVAGCQSMSYKARFRPYELLDETMRWQPQGNLRPKPKSYEVLQLKR